MDYFGKAIAGEAESGGGLAATLMAADKDRKPPTPKCFKQRLLGADEVEKILKRKMAEAFGQVRLAFRSYDSDKSGSIGADEFRRLIAR